jgi:eukaryotic-like serine/threonine-protein kinase
VQRAVDEWSHRAFDLQHYYALVAQTQIDLYRGDPDSARRRWQQAWPDLRRSLVLRVQLSRCVALHLRASASLGVAVGLHDRARRRSILAEAEADARRLMRERAPWAVALGRLIAGTVAAAEERSDRAMSEWSAALQLFEQERMACFAAVARCRLATVSGVDDSRALRREADAFFGEQRIIRPSRMVALLAGELDERVTGYRPS